MPWRHMHFHWYTHTKKVIQISKYKNLKKNLEAVEQKIGHVMSGTKEGEPSHVSKTLEPQEKETEPHSRYSSY